MKRTGLIQARLAKNLTQEQLATLVNLKRTAITNLELGFTKKGDVETWDKLEKVLGEDQKVLRRICRDDA